MTGPLGPRSGRITLANSNPTPVSATSLPAGAVALYVVSNTGPVDVGDENVVADGGWPLHLVPLTMDVPDLRRVYVRGTAGDVIAWCITKLVA